MSMNENDEVSAGSEKRLGRLPLKTTRGALLFSDFFRFIKIPPRQDYWTRVKPLPVRTYGNTDYGDCTRAKQAVAQTRMERLEQRKVPTITDEEVIRVYLNMTQRLYGGGDTGAYEDDALKEWRNPETTFRDVDGHPYTIDAYLRINALNHDEMKAALALSAAKGIEVCMNLPAAFSRITPPDIWDIPKDQPLIGEWMPGSWGGHSLHCHGFDDRGFVIDHTWGLEPQHVSYEAAAAYLDEAHMVIDSVDAWRRQTEMRETRDALGNVADAVNAVSAIHIEL